MDAPIEGIVVRPEGEQDKQRPAFRVAFLDREVRFAFGYDRANHKGIVFVQDTTAKATASRAGAAPVAEVCPELSQIAFENNGATDIEGAGTPKSMCSLHDPTDSIDIMLHALDSALDAPPR